MESRAARANALAWCVLATRCAVLVQVGLRIDRFDARPVPARMGMKIAWSLCI
ncbi:MAG: hypothetical protein JWP38_1614 [Herbaspirillum sp.]|nr:hypothetical protein [Herbaspirillum sp.]